MHGSSLHPASPPHRLHWIFFAVLGHREQYRFLWKYFSQRFDFGWSFGKGQGNLPALHY